RCWSRHWRERFPPRGPGRRPQACPHSTRPTGRFSARSSVASSVFRRGASSVLVAALAGAVSPPGAGAQATGMPSFNAPYRAFQRSELGGVFSFPEGGGTAFEGVYRYASGKFDIGLRGGFFDPGSGFKTVVLAGVEARTTVL